MSAVPAVGPGGFPAPVFPPATPAKSSSKTIWIIAGAMLVIVAIPVLVIVAAMVIPGMINERISANEAGAIQNLKKLDHALNVYRDTYQHGYPTDLSFLGPRASGPPNEFGAALVESPLTLPEQSGYRFSYDARELDPTGHAAGFVLYVDPVSTMEGRHHFYLDESGTIRTSRRTAGKNSPPLEPQYRPDTQGKDAPQKDAPEQETDDQSREQ